MNRLGLKGEPASQPQYTDNKDVVIGGIMHVIIVVCHHPLS